MAVPGRQLDSSANGPAVLGHFWEPDDEAFPDLVVDALSPRIQ